jgi:hypothetical protein
VQRALEKRSLSQQVRGLLAERAFCARESASADDPTTPGDVREDPESEHGPEESFPVGACKPDRT